MKTRELDSFLEVFRKKVEDCWSEKTAYKVPEVKEYGPGIPAGQCVVTSILLKQEMEKILSHANITLHLGSVVNLDNRVLIPHHGWLSIFDKQETSIIDTTIDQTPLIKHKFIFSNNPEKSHGLVYKEKKTLPDSKLLERKDLYQRYQTLEKAYFANAT